MKKQVLFILALLYLSSAMAQTQREVEYFKLQDIRLLESPFKHAQELDKEYLLALDADRLLAPFLREAGLIPKAESYTNWENTGLDGHIGGHYISALSMMYASTGDLLIKQRLDYMIDELKHCQDKNGDGYIGGVPGGKAIWEEVAAGNIRAASFSLNDKWVPLYNIHKTYAGLRDAYLYADNNMAKDMLIKMTDWAVDLVSGLSEEQIQDMLRSEHGGLNETFADAAAITGNGDYLKLAHQFSHRQILDFLLQHEDKLTGMHANTQIPKVLGFKRIADLENNESWSEAARFFWQTVVEKRSVSIGGNSVSEHFNSTSDFSKMVKSIEGPETCNTYNMLRLTKMLYGTSKDEKYVDYYERALYNHILSTQNPVQGGFVYFTQMRPAHYRVYSQPQTSFWCCVGSGLENHAKYGEMIYAHTENELFVNLFIPSRLDWKAMNTEIIQQNKFPDEDETHLTVNPDKDKIFTLQLRYPEWVEKGALKISINGKDYPLSQEPATYIAIKRKWKKGDKVTMKMPMHIKLEQLPDKSNYYSILYGPIVLAAKAGTEDMEGLFADDSRGGHIAHGKQIPIKDMPIIVSEPNKIESLIKPVEGKSLTFHLSGLYPDKYGDGMELIPFFRLHESRYILYWAQATTDEVKNMQKRIEQEEEVRIKLDAITVDKVVCGEQQPESDHFIQSDHSNNGFVDDIHWREAKGWFSYRLQNTNRNSKELYISYFNSDPNRSCTIYINGIKLTTLDLDGKGGDSLFSTVYPIPESEQGKDILEVKFVASPDKMTMKLAETRLLKND
ncbi:hypothetical protein CLV62_1066 [Dysgonomonas alginatilytica]|uniref:Uncharacterized protein n=1 Tax=Dysgonomonas alginatilytica TaxID=1605892 RepID=A0A2V3PSR8_9BACT|nr:glycoside hydrolase family 127 protein [Dysgonomonas alginatilytica]PXV65833.1 hypothetical protein CLV62_1066 [Dysgonomonas alginatilytica]